MSVDKIQGIGELRAAMEKHCNRRNEIIQAITELEGTAHGDIEELQAFRESIQDPYGEKVTQCIPG